MAFKFSCPECGHEIESKEDPLDIINAVIGTGSFDHPEEELNGWKIFFTGYKETTFSIDFTGYAAALLPLSVQNRDHVLVVVAGSRTVQSLKRGQAMCIDHERWLSYESLSQGAGPFLELKKEAMQTLREYIMKLEQPHEDQPPTTL